MTQSTTRSLESVPCRPLIARATAVLMLLGMAMACSGNTYLGGGELTAGTAGTSGTQVANQGGNGHTTTSTSNPTLGGAGGNKGGATGKTATTSTCALIECFRNVQCVTSCDGPVVQDGCCACPSGSFDSIQCRSMGGATGAGGATGTGGATTKGGSSATGGVSSKGGAAGTVGSCNDNGTTCFRAVNCVAQCGGAVLQSGCCPCPTGTFDSIQCTGVGGATGAGGASSKGGATSTGGATSSGGTGSVVECQSATDCQIQGDCCGCYAFGPGQSSSCPMDCLTSLTCNGFDPQPTPRCVAGHCVMNRSCDDSRVVCKRATPACAAGKMPSLTEDGTCWDGNCIDIVDCAAVTSCEVCRSNGLMCVYDNGVLGVAHCVPKPYDCMAMSSCSCFGKLCGGVIPCTDTATGISCGGG